MTEDEPTPEELREAEALARALSGDATAHGAADARAVAGFMRYVAEPHLDPRSAAEIRAALLRAPRRAAPVLWVSGALAAAATLLFVWLSSVDRSAPVASTPGAPDSREAAAQRTLLDAQARALADQDRDLAALASASAGYRQVLLATAQEQP